MTVNVLGHIISVGDLVVFDYYDLTDLVGIVTAFDGRDPVIEVDVGVKWNPWYQLHIGDDNWNIHAIHPGHED